MDQILEISVNTDVSSEAVRLERGLSQYEIEKSLGELVGKSRVERNFVIREQIFGKYKEINGDPPNIVSRDVFLTRYPPPEVVASRIAPALSRFCDEQEERIVQIPDLAERERQGYRLAAASYYLGILGHQFSDGNGQTNRSVSMSYIRQFCPSRDGHYLPIKYSKEWGEGESMGGFSHFVLEDAGEVIPVDIKEEDFELYKVMKVGYRQISDAISKDVDEAANQGRVGDFVNIRQGRLVEYVDRLVSAGVDPEMFKELDLSYDAYRIRAEVTHLLLEKYPHGYFGPDTNYGQVKANTVIALTDTDEGKRAMDEYIRYGTKALAQFQTQTGREDVSKIYERSSRALEVIETEFDRLLRTEDEETHKRKYESARSRSVE